MKVTPYLLFFFCMLNVTASERLPLIQKQPKGMPQFLGAPQGQPVVAPIQPAAAPHPSEIYNTICCHPSYWTKRICPVDKPIDPCSTKRCCLRVGACTLCSISPVVCAVAGYATGCVKSAELSQIYCKTECAKKEQRTISKQCFPVCCAAPCMFSFMPFYCAFEQVGISGEVLCETTCCCLDSEDYPLNLQIAYLMKGY